MTTPRRTKVKIFQSAEDSKYYVRIVAGNGKILAHSQGYDRRSAAINAADLLAAGGELVDE